MNCMLSFELSMVTGVRLQRTAIAAFLMARAWDAEASMAILLGTVPPTN